MIHGPLKMFSQINNYFVTGKGSVSDCKREENLFEAK
jgi:hypothetical protein